MEESKKKNESETRWRGEEEEGAGGRNWTIDDDCLNSPSRPDRADFTDFTSSFSSSLPSSCSSIGLGAVHASSTLVGSRGLLLLENADDAGAGSVCGRLYVP